jgi:hypothetical protein
VQHPASPAVARPSCQTLGLAQSPMLRSSSSRSAAVSVAEVWRVCLRSCSRALRNSGAPREEETGVEVPSFGRSCRRAVEAGAAREGRAECHCSSQPSSRSATEQRMKQNSKRRVAFLSPSSAGKLVRSGVAAEGCQCEPSPNPSIEGTCNIRLRRLSPAPHVKR